MNDFDDRASLTSSLSSKSTSDIGDTLATTLPTRIHRSPMKKLTLIVDKTRCICSTAIFQSQPETLLGKMFSAGLLKPGKKPRALLSSFQVYFEEPFLSNSTSMASTFLRKIYPLLFSRFEFRESHLASPTCLQKTKQAGGQVFYSSALNRDRFLWTGFVWGCISDRKAEKFKR